MEPTPEVTPASFTLDDYKHVLAGWTAQAKLSKRPEIQTHYNDVLTLAITISGEAEGHGLDAKVAVAWTVLNRVKDRGMTVTDRCLQRLQYSCWWEIGGAKNYQRVMALAQAYTQDRPISAMAILMRENKYLAGGVLAEAIRDNTHGATHYYAVGTPEPKWAKGHTPCAVIGPHLFFKHIAWS